MRGKRLFGGAAALALIAQQAHAGELVNPPSLDTNPATLETGWTFVAGKLVGTAVRGKRASIAVTGMKPGDIVNYQVQTANVTAGSVQVMIGGPRHGSLGSSVPSPSIAGAVRIPDNFTTSLGLRSGAVGTIDNSTEEVGAFRFGCNVATVKADDFLFLPGFPGASHDHTVTGNNGFSAYSNYRSLRLTGSGSCGDPKYPVNRSVWWMPSMITGSGSIALPFWQNHYYKRLPPSFNCNAPPSSTSVGQCVMMPNGIGFLWGYSLVTGLGGPADTDPNREGARVGFECRTRADINTRRAGTGQTDTIDDLVDQGCTTGDVLYTFFDGPDCWNGTELDSSDHRSHVDFARPTNGTVAVNWTILGVAQTPTVQARCDLAHPYRIPTFAWQGFFLTDASFALKQWHVSSDEMLTTAVKGGYTLHMDYKEGWGEYKDSWNLHCLDEHRTCSVGENGIGQSMNNAMPNMAATPARARSYELRPLSRTGMSRKLATNGTFVGELTALAPGEVYLYSSDGFTGDVLYWSVTTKAKISVRSGAVTHTH